MIPNQIQTANVLANWEAYLNQWATQQNQAAITQYQAALKDWNLNATIYRSLGIAVPPKPMPAFAVSINLTAEGLVAEPEFIQTKNYVCPPAADPAPAPVDPTPGLGAPMDAAGIYFAAKSGDNAPDSTVLHVNGQNYQKHIAATPFGVRQWYERM